MADISKYAHSPAHLAVVQRDHDGLQKIVSTLPKPAKAGEVNTEEESLAAEQQADVVSSVLDRRDVPGRETPLHIAVRIQDPLSAEILMAAGIDWSLQNENGWSALQEAVCNREEEIARVIVRHYQPLAWAKWCRRLPRVVASVARIRDFYMELTFHFESSVIPFIGRIAPSDTYRIWKRGSNLRADMTLAGFDGLRIQRSDQTFLFLGEGYSSEDDNVSLLPGSLIVLSHKKKEVTNALEGAGSQLSEPEVAREVALMSQTNMYRPGIDVTQAELVAQSNWRRQEKTETVGQWKAKVYDMLNVMVSVKSRRVPGAITDKELFAADDGDRLENVADNDELDGILTAEERKQLDSALRGNSDDASEGVEYQESDNGDSHKNGITKGKKSWFGRKNKKGTKNCTEDPDNLQTLKKSSKAEGDNQKAEGDATKGKGKNTKKKKKGDASQPKLESEYKKGLRPVLWLTPDFPLKTEELLPLLDILASKVKAVRRLRELLTTTFPPGTFPVKVAIPLVPTIRVVITFTKFEELQPVEEEFVTPSSSPQHFHDAPSKESDRSTSWISWMRGNRAAQPSVDDIQWHIDEIDPFYIPSDYTWVDAGEKLRRMQAKRAKNKKNKKQVPARNTEGGICIHENIEK